MHDTTYRWIADTAAIPHLEPRLDSAAIGAAGLSLTDMLPLSWSSCMQMLQASTDLARQYELSRKNGNQLIRFIRQFRKKIEAMAVRRLLHPPYAPSPPLHLAHASASVARPAPPVSRLSSTLPPPPIPFRCGTACWCPVPSARTRHLPSCSASSARPRPPSPSPSSTGTPLPTHHAWPSRQHQQPSGAVGATSTASSASTLPRAVADQYLAVYVCAWQW